MTQEQLVQLGFKDEATFYSMLHVALQNAVTYSKKEHYWILSVIEDYAQYGLKVRINKRDANRIFKLQQKNKEQVDVFIP